MCSTSSSRVAAVVTTGTPDWSLAPGRNLNQLGKLLPRQRRGRELERDGILRDLVESDDRVRIDRSLGEEAVARSLGGRDRNTDEIGVGLQRGGVVRIQPVDRLAVSLHEPLDDRLALLQDLHI